MKNHILIKSLLFSLIVGLVCFFTFKGNCADLSNKQYIGQKNRNQAVGKGMSIADSTFLLSIRAHYPDSTLLGIDTSSHVILTGCQCIYHVRDSISSTQILSSHSSPITIIQSPGVGYFIHPISISGYYIYSTASYSVPNTMGLFVGDTSHAFSQFSLDGETSNHYSIVIASANTQTINFSNTPITLFTNNADPTTSGGLGYVILNFDYAIEKY